MRADGQTWTDVWELTGDFRDYTNAPNNESEEEKSYA
jgi:hypothetical protein